MKLRVPLPFSICAFYFLLHNLAHFSANWFEVSKSISIWYPPCGLALSLLILLGPRYAPVVFGTNVFAAILSTGFVSWWSPLLFPALITVNYAGAACLIRRYSGTTLFPETRRGTLVFVLVAIGAPATIALVGTGLLQILGVVSEVSYFESVFRWLAGDISGILTVVPVVLVFVGPWLVDGVKPSLAFIKDRKLVGIILLQILCLLGSLVLVFAVEPMRLYNAFYLCFIPLIWVAIRHGLPGATLATLTVTMGGLIGMHILGTTHYLVFNFLLFELAAAAVGLGLGSAVTRRNEIARKLAASEARFERVISGAQLGLWDWNISTKQIFHNKRWASTLGSNADEMVMDHETWQRKIHPSDKDRVLQALQAHLDGRSPFYEIEYRVRTGEQKCRWILSRGSIVARDENNRPLLVSGTHIDITDRKYAEAETRRLLQVIEANTDFIVTTDKTGRIVYANEAFLRIPGLACSRDLSGGSLMEYIPDRIAHALQTMAIPNAITSGSWQGEIMLKNPKSREIPVSLVLLAHRNEDNEAVNLSFIMRDISPLRLAEAERIEGERKMLQAQKLESLGVLAGGIAHDFNNLLTVMLGNASLARLDLPEDSGINSFLTQIETAATSAAELCQQMLAYAGRSPLAFTQVNVTDLIEDTTHLIQITLGKKHALVLDLAHPSPLIQADATQIRQIIMNLTLNASQAIGEKAGRIVIRTRSEWLDSVELGTSYSDPTLPAGPYLVLEVEDSGCGMPQEVQARLFEPFFTTKFSGHGLGLAAVLGIVKCHNGAIRVTTTQDKGSTFSAIFPSINKGVTSLPPARRASNLKHWQGTGLVLVIDDEASVRNTIVNTLSSLGFTSLVAADGAEGIELFQKQHANLRFVILDLTMPRMNGDEAFRALHSIAPEVPVILMSGFSEAQSLERFVGPKPTAFIAKPFNHQTLDTCLRQLGAMKPSE